MNRINISVDSYEYTIEDGYFKLHDKSGTVKYPEYVDVYSYVKSHSPVFICIDYCTKDKEQVEEILNTEISFKCKFGTKRIKLGYLYRLNNLFESSDLPDFNKTDKKAFLDWVVYFDVKYENAYVQYELTKLFKTQDFLREIIEQRFALKKMVENKPLEQITVYTDRDDINILYANKSGIVTGSRTNDSSYVLRFEQAARDWETIEKMVSKVPSVVIGHPVSIDKLKSTSYLINWCIKNIHYVMFSKYSKFISEILIECDLEVTMKTISDLSDL
jgi:hypothetical protein